MTDESADPTKRRKSRRGTATKRSAGKQAEEQMEAIQQQIATLSAAVSTMAGYERIANVIEHGVLDVAAELRPLRRLTPTPLVPALRLGPNVIEGLGKLRRALKVHDWSNVGALEVEERGVSFIGAVPPDEADRDADDRDDFVVVMAEREERRR